MPKKGKGKGKGKSKKTKAADNEPVVLDLAEHPELDPSYDPLAALYADPREFERIHSLELENDTMKMIARELRLRLEKHWQSLTQIISHLNLEITKKDFKINELDQKTSKLDDDKANMQHAFSSESESLATEYSGQLKVITDSVGALRKEYESMLAVKEEKESLEENFAQITADLEVEKREHAMEVSALERRNVVAKETLKNEMLQKIKETKTMLLAMTEDQLHTTTKRTIMENDQMTSELMIQSKETERLLKINNKLVRENKSLQRQVDLNDEARAMLIRRSQKLQDVINRLNEDLSKRHKKYAIMRRSDDPNKDLAESNKIITGLEARLQDLDSMVRRCEDDTGVLRAQLADSRESNNQMLGLQDEALTFTLMVFESVKMNNLAEIFETEGRITATEDTGTRGTTTLPPINQGSGTSQRVDVEKESTFDSIHNKLQMVAMDDGRANSRKGQNIGGLMAFKDKRVTELSTITMREAFLDSLIKKFNNYSATQLRLITQHAI